MERLCLEEHSQMERNDLINNTVTELGVKVCALKSRLNTVLKKPLTHPLQSVIAPEAHLLG